MRTPDNYDLWKDHEREREGWLERLPVCDVCGEPIQDDHYYLINDSNICPECLEDQFRKEIGF